MDRDHGLLSKDIVAVDLRLADRMAVQLSPEAAVRRDADDEAASSPSSSGGSAYELAGRIQRPFRRRRSGVVTVLDVGSSKVCCMIGRLKPRDDSKLLPGRTHQIQVVGIGHQKSQGVKSGVIVDLDRAEQAVRLAVDAAERMAGLTVDSLIVNVSAGRLKSEVLSATINLGGHETDAADIRQVLAAGARQALRAERQIVHSLPVAFSLDAERGIRDPRGMVGDAAGRRHACADGGRGAAAQPRTLHQPGASFGRAHGGHTLCQRALGAGRGRRRDGRGLHRHRRWHHDALDLR